MNKKVEKYRNELEKCLDKVQRYKARADELQRLITEAENTEIVSAVRSMSLKPEELMQVLAELRLKVSPSTAEEPPADTNDNEAATVTEPEAQHTEAVGFEHSFSPSYYRTYKEASDEE